MAGQIRAALAQLEQGGAMPGFLGGESAPATQTSPSENLAQARDVLVQTVEDEAERVQREREEQRLAEQRRRERAERERLLAEQRLREQAEAEQRRQDEEAAQRRRERTQRIQRGLSSILTSLPAILGGGATGGPPPAGGSSGGGEPAADVFSGTWAGYGVVTSHREGRDPDRGPVVDARVDARENEIGFRLTKSNFGYLFEGFDGLRATSTSVRGNRISASGRLQAEDGRWATFTVDYEVNGDRLTGTSRGEGEDGSLIVMSVTCTRQ
jgi:hypothetical protein